MKANMGKIDRSFRIGLAIGILVAFLTGIISGVAAYVMLGLAVVFAATSFVRVCPLYLPFGIRTFSRKEVEAEAK